jgi:hypothetical protein
MKTREIDPRRADLQAFSSDPCLAELVQSRLSKMNARNERKQGDLLRRARELRRGLMRTARASN